jgi:hypothetical protein
MKIGLSKLAEDSQTEVIQPEEKNTGTAILCNSDCRYSQNPEKLCMLTHIALTMGNVGEFVCGQYSPLEQPQDASAKTEGQTQAKREIGLSGAKTKN